MRNRSVVFLVLALCWGDWFANPARAEPPAGLTLGVVEKDAVFAATCSPPPILKADVHHQVILSRVPLKDKRVAPEAENFRFFQVMSEEAKKAPYHWRIAEGYLWGGYSKVQSVSGDHHSRLDLKRLASSEVDEDADLFRELGKLRGGPPH